MAWERGHTLTLPHDGITHNDQVTALVIHFSIIWCYRGQSGGYWPELTIVYQARPFSCREEVTGPVHPTCIDAALWMLRNPSSCTAPHVSTTCLPDFIVCDQISQAFPLRMCILQAIKYWRWEWPGNEARISVAAVRWEIAPCYHQRCLLNETTSWWLHKDWDCSCTAGVQTKFCQCHIPMNSCWDCSSWMYHRQVCYQHTSTAPVTAISKQRAMASSNTLCILSSWTVTKTRRFAVEGPVATYAVCQLPNVGHVHLLGMCHATHVHDYILRLHTQVPSKKNIIIWKRTLEYRWKEMNCKLVPTHTVPTYYKSFWQRRNNCWQLWSTW